MKKEFIVEKESLLFEYLRNNLNGVSKNNIKSLLTRKCVMVNGKVVTKYDYKLKENDKVIVGNTEVSDNIKIIYEDKDIIVVNKPVGILSIETDKKEDYTLYNEVKRYVKRKNANNKIFVVHRLDKDTSGVILFAKNEKIKLLLQKDWNNLATRIYYAVVEGKTNDKGVIKNKLKETKELKTIEAKDGKEAITIYKKVKGNGKYSLLEIEIKTGRRNQIRVSMSNMSHPIVGDKVYGNKDSSERMLLHAKSLTIKNPLTNKEMVFDSEIPKVFFSFFKD